MGCGSSTARLAATEAELEQTRSHLAALQRSSHRAQTTLGEHEATFARLDTERTQVDLAFLDALAAPAFVRVAGAMNMGGGPIPTINGDYEKTTDMRNDRAVYKKVGDDKRAMWMGPNGIWYMGHVGEGGKNVGGTSTGAMAASKAGNETSPDLVSSEWKVGPASFGGKGSEFVPQTNISVGAVSAAEVAEARRVEEEEGAASLDRAAQYVRVAGATDKSGERIRTINGDYEKTTDMRNGRAVYKKVGDDKRAMWMGPNGIWYMGHVGEGEESAGGASTEAMAAGKAGNELSPDLVSNGWKVASSIVGRGSSGFVQQASMSVVHVSDALVARWQAAAAARIRVSGLVRDDGMPCDSINGDYDKLSSTCNCHVLYSKVDDVERALWYSPSAQRWVVGAAALPGGAQGLAYLACTESGVSLSPVKAEGEWVVEGCACAQPAARVEALLQKNTWWSPLPNRAPATDARGDLADGNGRSEVQRPESSRFMATKLTFGSASESDLAQAIGLDDPGVLAQCIAEPLKEMAREWYENGSDADWSNFRYVCHGKARARAAVPLHVRETFRTGVYHGGSVSEEEYDAGHDGWDLAAFCQLETAALAGLGLHHVGAIRLYTSDSYPLFNAPMRDHTCPHPIKTTVYFLSDALKKLRKVGAKVDSAAYNEVVYLWRGIKGRALDTPDFRAHGGTELAPMSTTGAREIAQRYAGAVTDAGDGGGQQGLLMSFATRGLSRGVEVHMFSLYPKEREFLYPPLTYLLFDETREIEDADGLTTVPVLPTMP